MLSDLIFRIEIFVTPIYLFQETQVVEEKPTNQKETAPTTTTTEVRPGKI